MAYSHEFTHMTPQVGFPFFLLLTVLVLAGVAWSGFARRRPLHFTLVASALACLAMAIVFAKRLGGLYDLESAGWITPFHLGLAKFTTACYLLPLVTGIATLRRPRTIVWHRRAAFLVLGLTLLSTATGAWMLLASTRIP